MRISRRVALVCALLSLAACRRQRAAAGAHEHAAGPEVELPAMTVAQVADTLARGERLAVFDVNNRARYERGHVPGARWVSLSAMQPGELPADHATPLVFYCANEH